MQVVSKKGQLQARFNLSIYSCEMAYSLICSDKGLTIAVSDWTIEGDQIN